MRLIIINIIKSAGENVFCEYVCGWNTMFTYVYKASLYKSIDLVWNGIKGLNRFGNKFMHLLVSEMERDIFARNEFHFDAIII